MLRLRRIEIKSTADDVILDNVIVLLGLQRRLLLHLSMNIEYGFISKLATIIFAKVIFTIDPPRDERIALLRSISIIREPITAINDDEVLKKLATIISIMNSETMYTGMTFLIKFIKLTTKFVPF